MKKLISILFLSLICLTTIPAKLAVWDIGNELVSETEDREAENKETKKVIKEYTALSDKKLHADLIIIYRYKVFQANNFLQPTLDKYTPPPDATC